MAYERIFRLSLFSLFASLILGLGSAIRSATEPAFSAVGSAFLGLAHVTASDSIRLDRLGHELDAKSLPSFSAFAAFVNRALSHRHYNSGRFDVGELSTAS